MSVVLLVRIIVMNMNLSLERCVQECILFDYIVMKDFMAFFLIPNHKKNLVHHTQLVHTDLL